MANEKGVKPKLSLKAKLDQLSLISLAFIDLTRSKDKDGNAIAILTLAKPIPNVRGSQEVEVGGVRYPVNATDVKEIKIHENDFNDNFTFDEETNTGEYKGSDLILDVSKTKQVWLRKVSFAQSGNDFRTKASTDRLTKMLGITVSDAKVPATGVQPVDQ